MFAGSDRNTPLASRRAIEALRNGVPNRYAVQELDSNRSDADWFIEMLDDSAAGQAPEGRLISGEFGAGKSHRLAELELIALSRNFVTSRVAVSKEMPLYDLGKVVTAAVECGKLPDRKGRLIEELASQLNPSYEAYDQFCSAIGMAIYNHQMNMIFQASRAVHERSGDEALKGDIEAFWGGYKIEAKKINDGLKSIGKWQEYRFKAPRLTELPSQRLRFIAELIKAAGYRGWVVFLDEIELVGYYTKLGRARSYAEVARWIGDSGWGRCPGVIAVGAVTSGFVTEVVGPGGNRRDCDNIGPWLDDRDRWRDIRDATKAGMDLLLEKCESLKSPEGAAVDEIMERLRDIYARAYGVRPPPASALVGGAGQTGRMRYRVRAAINEWDLRRLRPDHHPEIEAEEHKPEYREDRDMEKPTGDDAE